MITTLMDYDYTDCNLLSISTLEHCGLDTGYNQPQAEDLAQRGLEKIIKQSRNYLITFPIGANRFLEDYVKKSDLPYTILRRTNFRGEVNNWVEDKNLDNFFLNYGHFEQKLNLYGNSLAIVVISSEAEIVSQINR
jgi:hypothetical protein